MRLKTAAGLLLVLMLGTVVFFTTYPRFGPSGPQLLGDADFRQGFAHWRVSGRGEVTRTGPGQVSLRITDPKAGAALRQVLGDPHRFTHLRLSGQLRAMDIRAGSRPWHNGRLALVSLDENDRMVSAPHLVAQFSGDRDWTPVEAVFRVPGQARTMMVSVQLIGATGRLEARDIRLYPVAERLDYRVLKGVTLACWLGLLVWFAVLQRRRLKVWLRHPHPLHLLAALVVLGILVGTMMPVEQKKHLEAGISAAVHTWVEADSELDVFSQPTVVNKLGHGLLFALLALVVARAVPRMSRWRLLFWLLLFAGVSEVLQFFVDGRQPRLFDLAVDGAGLLLGLCLAGAGRQEEAREARLSKGME